MPELSHWQMGGEGASLGIGGSESEGREASQMNNNKPNMHLCQGRREIKAGQVTDSMTHWQQLRKTGKTSRWKDRQKKYRITVKSSCVQVPDVWARGEVEQGVRMFSSVRAERWGEGQESSKGGGGWYVNNKKDQNSIMNQQVCNTVCWVTSKTANQCHLVQFINSNSLWKRSRFKHI